MTKLYVPVACLGSDKDYFPVTSEDSHALQFFSAYSDAVKEAKRYIDESGGAGDFYIMDMRVVRGKKAKGAPINPRPNRYDWQPYIKNSHIPSGRRVNIEGTQNGERIKAVAWRISRNEWNWLEFGKIAPMPEDVKIEKWQLMRKAA